VHIDPWVALAGLVVGFTVGMTGMGGGALMTPILVLVFGVQPLAAVSSDLVASFVMKPVGSAVHLRRGTVHRGLVKYLVIGSVPAAFSGVFVLRALGNPHQVQHAVQTALGVALVVAAASMCAKALLQLRRWARERDSQSAGLAPAPRRPLVIKPLPTVLIGAVGGLVVGMTSVGSGSLIIVTLLMLYPSLRASELVGTDLVQAVPRVGAAALGHVLYGDFHLGLTASLLIGSLPGVYLGARVSSAAPGGLVRRALVIVLTLSGLKLLGMSTPMLGVVLAVSVLLGPLAWSAVRRLNGLSWRPEPRRTARVDA
jgi:uncharacterized protein